jgi:thymidylate synthase
VKAVIASLKHDPDSRRHVISMWNPLEQPRMALPPCHGSVIQFYVRGRQLDCMMVQRSADLVLGLPYNIASYALLTHMIAQQTGYEPGELIWTGGDCHIYSNHVEQVREQLGRGVRPFPRLAMVQRDSIDDYQLEDFAVAGYNPHPAIKAPVAV